MEGDKRERKGMRIGGRGQTSGSLAEWWTWKWKWKCKWKGAEITSSASSGAAG